MTDSVNVEFSVYGRTVAELEAKAYARLAELSSSDTQWDVRFDIQPNDRPGSLSSSPEWRGGVYARRKNDRPSWQDGS